MRIDIDFEVFKALTLLRTSEHHTENAVLRELLGLPAIAPLIAAPMNGSDNEGWTSHGVTLANGTMLKGSHNGKHHFAKIEDGKFLFNGTAYNSPSHARYAVTQTGGNGWWFWTVKKGETEDWEAIWHLRDRIKQGIEHESLTSQNS